MKAAEERATDGEEESAGGDEERRENQEVWERSLLPQKRRRCFCLSGFLLGLVYVLVLAGIYTRYMLTTFEGQKLAAERDQLNSSVNELMTRLSELNQDLTQLNVSLNLEQARNVKLSAERDELQRQKEALGQRLQKYEWVPDVWFNF